MCRHVLQDPNGALLDAANEAFAQPCGSGGKTTSDAEATAQAGASFKRLGYRILIIPKTCYVVQCGHISS